MEGVTTLVGQGLYMALAAVAGLGIARLLKRDDTLGCLIAGVLAGMLLPVFDYNTGLRAENIHQLVFFIILPVLIFQSAWKIDPDALFRWLAPALLLATVGVLICALITAVLVYFGVVQSGGFPWIAALLTGTILAATDPAAIVARLRKTGANNELLTLLEGESLFNDAAAIVLFSFVLGIASHSAMEGAVATGEEIAGAGSFALYFAVVFFGGLAVGTICGLLTAITILFLRSAGAALVVLVLAAFGSFYLAEHVVGVSGILSVMICAIVARACLREQEQTYLAHAAPTWEWLGLLFHALIFVMMGLVITVDMFVNHWLAMIVAIVAAIGARGLAVFLVAPMARFVGPPITKNWRLILSWGGLRGVIAAALVLSLPVDLPYWEMVQAMVFGVVLFSLLVQGTTSTRLIRKLEP
ncbi:cation:proton antiporter [Microbulbifer harenosus]|uniref:Sodium:proton antiporter n=1 Tax=Microbulbifer harenosus TaxID=2576840 RepID=A0ABY2UIZ8_9GAMM|nr:MULTISPECIES: sodium:proton antiporter [Microbulbifer]QIL88665.1 sodium:proton antiporter [Microbulbifer sp. SH-1]TLM76160.1 sodium:proton antiporter [Microbulbifer harenosus]